MTHSVRKLGSHVEFFGLVMRSILSIYKKCETVTGFLSLDLMLVNILLVIHCINISPLAVAFTPNRQLSKLREAVWNGA